MFSRRLMNWMFRWFSSSSTSKKCRTFLAIRSKAATSTTSNRRRLASDISWSRPSRFDFAPEAGFQGFALPCSLGNKVLLASSLQLLLSFGLSPPPFPVSRFLQLFQLRHVLFCPSPDSSATVHRDCNARSYLLRSQPTVERDPMNADSLCGLLGRVRHHASTYSIFRTESKDETCIGRD